MPLLRCRYHFICRDAALNRLAYFDPQPLEGGFGDDEPQPLEGGFGDDEPQPLEEGFGDDEPHPDDTFPADIPFGE